MIAAALTPDPELLARLLAAIAAGAAIGYDRERHDKPAGLRTNVLICFGAALFTIVSCEFLGQPGNRDRIAASIISGVGFLGAGSIIHQRLHVVGMTTAATIWAVASIGMTFGAGAYALGAIGTLLALFVLIGLSALEDLWLRNYASYNMEAQATNLDAILKVRRKLEEAQIKILLWDLGKTDGQVSVNLRGRGEKPRLDRVVAELVHDPELVLFRRW